MTSGKNRSFSDTPRGALELREVAVHREEAQRHVRLAARQVADEVLQRQHRAVDDAHRRGARPRAAEAGEAALDRSRRTSVAPVQAHHAQRPAHLVQVLGARAQRVRILRRGA